MGGGGISAPASQARRALRVLPFARKSEGFNARISVAFAALLFSSRCIERRGAGSIVAVVAFLLPVFFFFSPSFCSSSSSRRVQFFPHSLQAAAAKPAVAAAGAVALMAIAPAANAAVEMMTLAEVRGWKWERRRPKPSATTPGSSRVLAVVFRFADFGSPGALLPA